MLTDSHCHLSAEAFAGDRDQVVARMSGAGLARAVVIASDAEDAAWIAEWIAERGEGAAPQLWGTAGVHPHSAELATPEALQRIAELARLPRVVAIGECGLDFHYDTAPRATQLAALQAQVAIADQSGLPLVVHSRSAEDETIEMLSSLPDGVRGVLHCFTGSQRLLDAGLAAGWHISFSGIVTFKRFEDAELVRAVPEDRILIETDSPYLAPVPFRGKRNEPSHVRQVAEVVAAMREVPVQALIEATARNAATLFGLPEPVGAADGA